MKIFKACKPRSLTRCIASLIVNVAVLVMEVWVIPVSFEMYSRNNTSWFWYFVLISLFIFTVWDIVRDIRDIVLTVKEKRKRQCSGASSNCDTVMDKTGNSQWFCTIVSICLCTIL